MAFEKHGYCPNKECRATITESDTVDVSYLSSYGDVRVLKVVCVNCGTVIGVTSEPR